MKKTIILDTNVYLTDPASLSSFGKDDIAIPTIVLDEIDKHKHRQDTAGLNARTMNRVLDSLRSKGSLMDGVPLGLGKGNVRFISMMANFCRNDFTDEQVIDFCRKVISNN